MSAGLSVTSGTDPLIVLAAGGGDAFSQRLQDLRQAKADAEAAFDALRLGNDAAKAWEDARVAQAAVDARLTNLEAELTELRTKAQADADRIRQEATDILQQAQAHANEMIAGAQAQAAQITSDANLAMTAATARQAELDTAIGNATAARAQADQDADAARIAKEAADASKAKYDQLDAALRALLG